MDKQITLHEEKRKKSVEEDNTELLSYYDKEIQNLKRTKEEKERLLKKGG